MNIVFDEIAMGRQVRKVGSSNGLGQIKGRKFGTRCFPG